MQTEMRHQDVTIQAAWLYYVRQLSQQEISDHLGISRFKVNRMLADARERGIVRIAVEHRTAPMLELADRLAETYGLTEVQVAPIGTHGEDGEYARRAVGILAASLLERIAGGEENLTIGLGWGRTLSAMADNLSGVRNRNLTFVSIMGSVTHATRTAPTDVCVRLANQTGGRAMLLPAPFVVDDPAACNAIMEQRLVREALEAARASTHAIMSVGECRPGAVLFESGLFSEAQIEELRRSNVVGDCCGTFFTADGQIADTPLNHAAPGVKTAEMSDMDVTILAGGATKAQATHAVLKAGFANRLIVDEVLAGMLLGSSAH